MSTNKSGAYLQDNRLRFDVSELLARAGVEDTEENRAVALKVAARVARERTRELITKSVTAGVGAVDLSFVRAAQVLADRGGRVRFVLIGCGGTGGWLAPSIVRLAYHLISAGREVEVMFVDPDRLEAKNIPRQNFCHAERGLHKAVALAARLTAAWSVPIRAITERFHPDLLDEDWGFGMRARAFDALTLLVGCVDNAKARRVMAEALYRNMEGLSHHLWWLDCGNSDDSGQVLLGSAPHADHLKRAFRSKNICEALPSPALQAPNLLKPKPEEKSRTPLSCAELMMLNAQSLTVNQQVAAVAADYLLRLTTTKPLRRFATYFDQDTGQSESQYVTPERVAQVAGTSVEHVMAVKTISSQAFLRGERAG